MGYYVYRLAAPSATVKAKLGDEEVALALLRYAYKPTRMGGDTNERWYRQYVTLPCAAWSKREIPPYAVPVYSPDSNVVGTPADGNPVLRWSPGRLAVADDPDWEGRQIGVLRVTVDAAGAPQYRIEPLPVKESA